MECSFCGFFMQHIAPINWLWLVAATAVSFGIGAVWYSVLFAKAWVKIFKVEMGEVNTASFVRTMGLQFVATFFLGLVFFVLTNISVWVALMTLIGIIGWEKAMLNFQFSNLKDCFMAIVIRAGYTFVAGIVFILFALL